jgi:hypothetical protein
MYIQFREIKVGQKFRRNGCNYIRILPFVLAIDDKYGPYEMVMESEGGRCYFFAPFLPYEIVRTHDLGE